MRVRTPSFEAETLSALFYKIRSEPPCSSAILKADLGPDVQAAFGKALAKNPAARYPSGHPLLVPAAMNAVRQWIYQRPLLNGRPIEVEAFVDVNFTLKS